MKKLARIEFEFEDGTKAFIEDPRAAALFQSRCNSGGVLSGMEDYLIPEKEPKADAK